MADWDVVNQQTPNTRVIDAWGVVDQAPAGGSSNPWAVQAQEPVNPPVGGPAPDTPKPLREVSFFDDFLSKMVKSAFTTPNDALTGQLGEPGSREFSERAVPGAADLANFAILSGPPRAGRVATPQPEAAPKPLEGEIITPEWRQPSSDFEFRQPATTVDGTVMPSGALEWKPVTQEPRPAPLSSGATTFDPGTAPAPPAPDVAQAAVLARVGRQPDDATLPNATDAYTNFVDNLHPVRKLVEAADNGTPLETALNPYEQFRLSRGVGGKSEHFLRHGTFAFDTLKDVGPSFEAIVKPVKDDLDGFKAYILSKRALELEQQGIVTGIPLDAARVTVDNGRTRFEATSQQLQKYQVDLLDYAEKSGLLSPEVVAAMREASKDYVPFYRIMDDPRGGGASKGFQAANPTFRIAGSERLLNDPLDSIIRNTQTFITLSERNRALNTFVDFANANPGLTTMKRVNNAQQVKVHGNEVADFLDELGIPSQLYGDLSRDSFNITRALQKDLKPNEIAVWKGGKRQVYEIDPQIAQIIKGLDQPDIDGVMRMLTVPAKLLRAGVVLSPEYMIRNITRDQMNAFIQSKNGYRPIVDMLSGLTEVMTNGKAYRDWMKSGGSQAALVAMDRDAAFTRIASQYGVQPTTGQKIRNVVTKPLDLLRVVSESMDNATRVGEFMRSTKGADDAPALMKGAIDARNVTQDFQRIGAKTRGINALTAFMNAQVQGLDRELSTLKNNPGPALIKVASLITLPSILLWLANRGDPRYENAPNWEKDAFWHILPDDPKKEPIRVPKPFTFGMLFGSLPERMLSDLVSKKPEAYNEFLKSLGGTMIPNAIPTFAQPVIEQFANRSTFMDRPLVPQRLERLVPQEQYSQFTPEVAKLAGRGVAAIPGMSESKLASPIILQNYVERWGGTLGKYAMAAGDAGLKAMGLIDPPAGPTKTLADIPVLRAFVSRYPSASAQPIADFYKKNEQIERIYNTMRAAQREGDVARTQQYEAQLATRVAGHKKQLDGEFRRIREIYADRTMGPDLKRAELTEVYMRMLDTAQNGLKVIRDAGSVVRKPAGYQGGSE